MATREEIREGIADIICEPQSRYVSVLVKGVREGRWEYESSRRRAKRILSYLHSQGVVIKVDKELPEDIIPLMDYFPNDSNESIHASAVRRCVNSMLKAGYVAVEPLIKG